MKPIAALFASRKFLLALVSVIVGAVFVWRGNLQIAQLATFVGVLVPVLIAAIAHEDAAKKSAAPAPVNPIETISAITAAVPAILAQLNPKDPPPQGKGIQ